MARLSFCLNSGIRITKDFREKKERKMKFKFLKIKQRCSAGQSCTQFGHCLWIKLAWGPKGTVTSV